VKPRVLALDFDGTIAVDGTVDAGTWCCENTGSTSRRCIGAR